MFDFDYFASTTADSSQSTRSMTPTPGTSTIPSVNPVTAGRTGEELQDSTVDGLQDSTVDVLQDSTVDGLQDSTVDGLQDSTVDGLQDGTGESLRTSVLSHTV